MEKSKKSKKYAVGDHKTIKGIDFICKGFDAEGKPQWKKADMIEKAKHNVGDPHPSKPWVWTEYKPGKFDWRPNPNAAKKDGGASGGAAPHGGAAKKTDDAQKPQGQQQQNQPAQPQKKIEDMTPDELVDHAKNASTAALEKVVNDTKADKQLRQLAFNELKTRDDYDKTKVTSHDLQGGYVKKPDAKIQYQTKKPEVEIPEFEDYSIQTAAGRKTVSISGLRKLYANKSEDELLKLLNNTSADPKKRHLAYEEAAARGIPEDKINTKGTLERLWKKIKADHDIRESMNKVVDEDEAMTLSYDWKGLDHEAIMRDVFEDGNDPAWLDPNSDIVKRTFKTETLAGRQKYDTFKDYYQRDPKLVPGYLNAQNKVNNLNGQMWEWAQSADSPLFVSAGGAGAGKTYGWKEIVAEDLSLPELKPGDDPKNTDWGYVMLTDENASDEKVFARTLAKYNGTFIGDDGEEHPHILFFDDADKILVTKSKPLMAMMKKINDADPDNRVFTNPDTGEQELWRGKIIITTNKDIAKLSGDEDTKAILSRATKSDIHFTRNETMELLADRYMNMGLKRCKAVFKRENFTEDEIDEFRQDVFDYMLDHLQEADPNKFTPRAFEDLAEYIAPQWKKGSSARKTGKGTIGTDIPWRISALSIIKADEDELSKADYDTDLYSKSAMVAQKKHLEEMMAEAKKNGKYDKLFGRKAQDAILFGGDTEEKSDKKKKSKKKEDDVDEAKKAFDTDMSLEEAENILFS